MDDYAKFVIDRARNGARAPGQSMPTDAPSARQAKKKRKAA
jgi:hypothetical protein